jgi:hypothetical protein
MRNKLFALCAALAYASAAPRARADGSATDAAAGGALFNEARALMAAGKYAEACAKLDGAKSLLPTAGTYLSLGDCYEKNGQTASAFGAFLEAMLFARKTGDHDREAEGKRRAGMLEAKLSKLALQLAPGDRGAGFVLHQNGRAIPEATWGSAVPIDPGEHTIDASSPGKQTWKTVIRVEPKPGTTTITVPVLADAPVLGSPAAGSGWGTQRIAGISVASAGIAGLLVGSILGGVALKRSADLKGSGQCNADLTVCNAAGLAARSSAQPLAHGSTAGFVIGGAALAAGLVVFFTAPAADVAPSPPRGARVGIGAVAGAGMTGVMLQGGW